MRSSFGRGIVATIAAVALTALLSSCGGSGGGAGTAAGSSSTTSTSTTASTTAGTASDDGYLGANLPGVADWSRSQVYVDIVRQARRYGSPEAPWDGKAALAADGWPTGDFGVVLFTGQSGVANVAGVYQGVFTGRATVTPVATDATVRNVAYDAATGTTRFEVVVPDPCEQLMLAFSGTGAGIRDLRLVRPGYSLTDTPLFTTAFLDHVRRFQLFRFMDWTATNDSPATTWARRPTPATVHHVSEQGVPWEHVVALANQLQKDIWINVPLMADDDYVTQLARLLKGSLASGLKVYVEYSNELWNYGFSQSVSNLALAQAEVAANAASPLAYDGTADRYTWAKRRVALRLKQISDLFRAVYGDAAMLTTVRPVLAGQTANPTIAQTGLAMIDAVFGDPAHYVHAIAGAPYFNLGDRQTTEGLSAAQVLERLAETAAAVPVEQQLEANLGVARWYGLRFFAYEGGPDTFGAGSLDAKAAAHLDPAMGTLCQSFLGEWYRQGGDLFMWYSAGASDFRSPFGAWTLTSDLTQSSAPKLRCMDSVAAAGRPSAVLRHVVPVTLPGKAFASSIGPFADPVLRGPARGDWVDYVVYAGQAGTYQLVLKTAAARAGNTVDVGVNNRSLVNGLALAVTEGGAAVDGAPIAIALPQGVSTIRVRTRDETSGYSLASLTVR